jgi:hypothetical protein
VQQVCGWRSAIHSVTRCTRGLNEILRNKILPYVCLNRISPVVILVVSLKCIRLFFCGFMRGSHDGCSPVSATEVYRIKPGL